MSLKHWESKGHFEAAELLTDLGVDFIERVEQTERLEDKFALIKEMMDARFKFDSEFNDIDVIVSFSNYLQKQLDYVLDICRANGKSLEVNKYDFLLFLQMQGLPLVKRLRETDNKLRVIDEIIHAYEARDFRIETITLDKWERIYGGINCCDDEQILQTLERFHPELPTYLQSFYEAMLNPANLTAWAGLCERQMRARQYTLGVHIFEQLPEMRESDLKRHILVACITLNGVDVQQEVKKVFPYLDKQLTLFLNKYEQDGDQDIRPLHPDKYDVVNCVYSILRAVKHQNPRSSQNIDKVLGLIENETAKFAKHVYKYSDLIETQA